MSLALYALSVMVLVIGWACDNHFIGAIIAGIALGIAYFGGYHEGTHNG